MAGPGPQRSPKSNAPTRNRTENLLIKSLTRAVSDRQGTPGAANSRQPRGDGSPQSPVLAAFSLEVPQLVTQTQRGRPPYQHRAAVASAYKNLYICRWRRSPCIGSGLPWKISAPFQRRPGELQATSWITCSMASSRVTGSPCRRWGRECTRSESMSGPSIECSTLQSLRRASTCSTHSRSGRARPAGPISTWQENGSVI